MKYHRLESNSTAQVLIYFYIYKYYETNIFNSRQRLRPNDHP
jgi:hypothetical protein